MNEKQIIRLSDFIVNDIVDFSMGKGKVKSLIPGSVARKLAADADLFEKVKQCYVEYLSQVDNKVDESFEVKRLTDFRYKLVEIFTQKVPEGEIDLEGQEQ